MEGGVSEWREGLVNGGRGEWVEGGVSEWREGLVSGGGG